MNRCVIIGGAAIEDYETLRRYLQTEDHCFYCDSGLRHQEGLGAAPYLIIGDFDSWEKPVGQKQIRIPESEAMSFHLKENGGIFPECTDPEMEDTEVIVLPHKKDDTDTVYAVKEALRRGYREFLMFGVTGQRLDHTLVNVYTLFMIQEQGGHGLIAADDSEMEIVGAEKVFISDQFSYFSLISIAGTARHVNIRHAMFELTDAEICSSYQYGCSNEVVPGEKAWVSVGEGTLLLLRIR